VSKLQEIEAAIAELPQREFADLARCLTSKSQMGSTNSRCGNSAIAASISWSLAHDETLLDFSSFFKLDQPELLPIRDRPICLQIRFRILPIMADFVGHQFVVQLDTPTLAWLECERGRLPL